MSNLFKYFKPTRAGPTDGDDNDEPLPPPPSRNTPQIGGDNLEPPQKKAKSPLGSTWTKWLKQFDWVIIDASKNSVKCRRCIDAGLKNRWTKGDGKGCGKTGWRLETLELHDKTHGGKVELIEASQRQMQVATAAAVEKASPGYVIIMKSILFGIQTELN